MLYVFMTLLSFASMLALKTFRHTPHYSHVLMMAMTPRISRRGIPMCCIRSSMGCPSVQPECDYSGRQPTRSTDAIPPGGVCRSGKVCKNGSCRALDVCESGYVCSNGRCRARSHRIRTGGVCRSDDLCEMGTKCIQNRCIVPFIPAGGICRFQDVCESGYVCTNGRCASRRSRSISYGGVCQLGDVCEDGTACINNRCVVPLVPPGGVCQYGDVCENGYLCINGRCDPDHIPPGGVCQVGDVCDSGYSCIGGICTLPVIPAGEICRSGIDTCVNEYICMNSKCIAPAWFASDGQHCVMDCLSTDSPCCGGTAQSWQHSYSTAEECCSQSMFQGNYDGCLSNSIQCIGDEHESKKLSVTGV